MDNLKTEKLSYGKLINNQLDSYKPISFRLEGSTLIIENSLTIKQPLKYIEL